MEEQQKKRQENVVAGLVGAFLGALLGVVCTVVIGQLGYVASLSGLIMAVGALKGYELLGGRLSKKGAVISSALCGMVSGSSVGNTVTTGSITIPMMKRTGYKPEFAGAVEAAASTASLMAQPREPVVPGNWERIRRPTSVVSEGEGVTEEP